MIWGYPIFRNIHILFQQKRYPSRYGGHSIAILNNRKKKHIVLPTRYSSKSILQTMFKPSLVLTFLAPLREMPGALGAWSTRCFFAGVSFVSWWAREKTLQSEPLPTINWNSKNARNLAMPVPLFKKTSPQQKINTQSTSCGSSFWSP